MDNTEAVGEIKSTELRDDDIVYGYIRPKTSCKHCHGRGVIGWNAKGDPIGCDCMTPKKYNYKLENYLTFGELKKLGEYTKDNIIRKSYMFSGK